MHAAILSLLTGEPDLKELPSRLGEGFPAYDVERTAYLDGREIHHGTLADYVTTEERVPIVGEDFITTDTEDRKERVATDFYADLELGWAGVNASQGEDVIESYLATTASVIPEPAELDLDAFSDALPEDVETNGIVYSTSEDEGHSRDAAGSHWQRDASTSMIPSEGTSVLHVKYTWDGALVDAMLAQSGYVAVYKDWTAATFARWVAEEIVPFLSIAGDRQQTFDEDEECVECGSTTQVERFDGEPLCLVHRDAREEAQEVDV